MTWHPTTSTPTLPLAAVKRPGPRHAAAGSAAIHADTLAEIVHELCTPAASIQAAVELLVNCFESANKQEASELLARVHQSASWLQDLLADLNQRASEPAGEDSVGGAPVNISECIMRALSVVEPLLARRHQRVDVETLPGPVMVWADEHLIRRVLVNLLTNASKYSRSHDVIEIAVAADPKWVFVEVRDHGPGVDDGERRHIFERRVRGATTRQGGPSGSGLGLSIVKSLVEKHGGRAGVSSDKKRGASFWFALPLTQPSRRHHSSPV